jgi:hypothetical protein
MYGTAEDQWTSYSQPCDGVVYISEHRAIKIDVQHIWGRQRVYRQPVNEVNAQSIWVEGSVPMPVLKPLHSRTTSSLLRKSMHMFKTPT